MITGIGYDSHKFSSGSRLRLGGIEIPYKEGLASHSDGDVVLHAIADAVLSASFMGGIGEMFSPSMLEYKDVKSSFFIREILKRLKERQANLSFVQVIIIAERPKLKDFIVPMMRSLSTILEISERFVNIQVKSNEGMGFIGRGEGIVCIAQAGVEYVTP